MVNAKIFIIHSESDNNILQKLYSRYNDRTFGNTKLKVEYLNSKQGSMLGKDFGLAIKRRINSSAHVLAIITPNIETSFFSNQEIGYTLGKKKRVIQIKEDTMSTGGYGLLH